MFRELFESPFRVGKQGKDAFSKEYEWNNHYKNSSPKLLTDNFTSKKYKIYKTEGSIFVVDNKGNYKLGVEYTTSKNPLVLRINTAHSKESKLFGKFAQYMLKYYTYFSSGDKQSEQAEKSWRHIVDKANSVYSDGVTIKPIEKSEVKDLYNTPTRIAISETAMFGHKFLYFEKEYYDKIQNSTSFRDLIKNDPDGADNFLFLLSI